MALNKPKTRYTHASQSLSTASRTGQRRGQKMAAALDYRGEVRHSEDDLAPVQVVERSEHIDVLHQDAC